MTGRGRPRKAKGPDTQCVEGKTRLEKLKPVSLPKGPENGFAEEKQKRTIKEQKPKARKKAVHFEEKPCVQSSCEDKTTKSFTEKTNKHQSTPTEITKACVQETKACADRDETTDLSAEKTTRRPKDSPKPTKVKKCGGKAKSPERNSEEVMKVQPETPKPTTKACVPQERCEDKVNSILNKTLENLKIKRDDRSGAAEVINTIVKTISMHLKQNTQCFKEVEELRTGSYYENLKISNPDEFDIMLTIPVDRVKVNPFGDDGAYYSVELKRGKSPLQTFQKTNTLSASEMLKEFREEVKKCVKQFPEWEVTRKKKGCPAVTLITTVQSTTISLDVVLSIMVKSSWPPFTKEGIKIDGWLGTKVKKEYKQKPYYLVPKHEGNGNVENDGVLAKDTWRVSFSHVEKAILKNHGSEKTCCEKAGAQCCRRECLKLLKHLLNLLKEKDSSFDKFCSYHAKTTLLHACSSRTKDSDWRRSDLSCCFQLFLNDFIAHLEAGVLNNFFIPTQNLLSGLNQLKCKSLARRIREEGENGFPIFK
ncbi:cyclic GMP-AMP synthase isoform X2 [Etheostoma cragini]|uniref:cyclic GMP-AMP synthase isoform X2 n=1 Tax=Etheostoma cragini TaxID=417921 RepID=UPI00155E8088|nr:cyclic GMP-AMP synthase isoform X2 [Etheostoma cragini]